jgi:hypothetical protein
VAQVRLELVLLVAGSRNRVSFWSTVEPRDLAAAGLRRFELAVLGVAQFWQFGVVWLCGFVAVAGGSGVVHRQ